MILDYSSIGSLKSQLADKELIFTDGVFDLLHPGHVAFLRSISNPSSLLMVCVLSDEWVEKTKGADRPVMSQSERLQMVDALSCVGYTLLAFDSQSQIRIPVSHLLERIRPNVFITTDQIWEQRKDELERWGIELKILPRLNVGNISTTELIRRIQETKA